MAKGRKTGGRRKGSPNKRTALEREGVRAAIQSTYDRIGGGETFAKWATDNLTEFYRIYSRLIPVEHTGESGGPIRLEVGWQP